MPANSDFKVKQGLRIGTKITSYNNNTAITNGQILIGNTTSGSFDVATITQGANLVITNAGGSITIAANANTSNSSGTLVLRGADGSFTANIVSVGGILSTGANGVSTIGNATAYFGNIFGTAMLARYADVAENYSADRHYEPGTVVQFGGEKEITLATFETPRVAGVISTKPAYLMNMDQQGDNMLAVALQGRVPCKVTGVVHKGDMMVSAGNGYAKACTMPTIGTVIGKALENYFSSVEGVIEVVVGRL